MACFRVSVWAASLTVLMFFLDNATAESLQGRCSIGTPADRIAACEAALKLPDLSPINQAHLHYLWALAVSDAGGTGKAVILEQLNAALILDPLLWPAHWIRAEILGFRRDYRTAAQDWTAVNRALPWLATSLDNRAIDLDNDGQPVQALADEETSEKLEGVDPDSESKALILANLGRYSEALKIYDARLQKYPRNAELLSARGRMAYALQDYPAAIADFRDALVADPTLIYTALWLYLAKLRHKEDPQPELSTYAASANLNKWPGPIVAVLLGRTKLDAAPPLPDEGYEDWRSIDRQLGRECELTFFTGEAALARGDTRTAVPLLRRAVATNITEFIEYRAARASLKEIDN